MKRMIFLWSMLALAAFQPGFAQRGDSAGRDSIAASKYNDIKEMLESGDFTFQAQRMLPMRGGMLQLMGGYDLRVSPKEVRSFLPYFGRLYMPPITPSDGPLRFESDHFGYSFSEKDNGLWEVVIRPKDIPNVQQLNLTVYDNGTANLRVLTNNRQPISFEGYID